MRRLLRLAAAFAVLVAGIEALKVVVAWWRAGRPAPGIVEMVALVALAVAGIIWWRISVFRCRRDKDGNGSCRR